MGDLLPLMENASALDWLTVGGLVYLGYRDRLQAKRIDELKKELKEHEDKCIDFRGVVYGRLGKLENDTAVLMDRHEREAK